MVDDIADQIYEAAFLPELWPNTLGLLAQKANCSDAALFATEGKAFTKWIATPATAPKVERYVREGWHARGELSRRAYLLSEPRFVAANELFTQGELDRQPFLAQFLTPAELYWGAATQIRGPLENVILFSVGRPENKGPMTAEEIDRLTALRPEFARASLISARLQLERARSTVETLQAIGLPSAVLAHTGKLAFANPSFEALVPTAFLDRVARLQFAEPGADALFGRFLGNSSPSGITIPIKATAENSPLLVHIVPVTGQSRDLFVFARWAMVVVPISQPTQIRPAVLEGLFDLTPSEARVAKALAGGAEIDTVAATFGVTPATIRSQLKSIFAKTGTRRQADLVAILSATRLIGNEP